VIVTATGRYTVRYEAVWSSGDDTARATSWWIIEDSLGSVKNRVLKALPDYLPSFSEGGGLIQSPPGGATGVLTFDIYGYPLIDVFLIASELATNVLDLYGTDAAELSADVDTNKYDMTAVLATILASNCGSSNKNVVFYVIDTSGVDDTLPNASVYMLNSGQTAVSGNGVTGGVGVVTIGLNESTTYNSVVRAPRYNFPAASLTTTAGATPDTVDLEGYDLVNTATPSSHMTTLTGETVFFGDTLKNCWVEVTLVGANAMYSSVATWASGGVGVYSDANGDWSLTIPGTDSLSAYMGGTPTYCVRYKHPMIQNGGVFEACNLSIPANGSTTKLRDILAQ